ncbi:hypothetical protein C942_02143 [Photobacterium marinum]|uniref:Uncharacterized protein n=1 Tax=Photobacterium marinum TaxID=1056511 RepID=L8JBV3_9GAMM|nr:hypothetical protein C942_02143 [Photobacterium marinum]
MGLAQLSTETVDNYVDGCLEKHVLVKHVASWVIFAHFISGA